MTGNFLKGSRPLLVFDKAFDEQSHLVMAKEMLTSVCNQHDLSCD